MPTINIAYDIHAVTEDFWPFCLSRLEQELPQQQFNTWIKTLRVESGADGAFTLIAPNRFVLQWVRERYLRRIHELGEEQAGSPLQIELQLPPVGAARASRPATASSTATPSPLPTGTASAAAPGAGIAVAEAATRSATTLTVEPPPARAAQTTVQ